MFKTKDGSMDWQAIGSTIAVVAVGVITAEVLRGALVKTDLGKKLLSVS